MKRTLSYVILCALPLLFSCGKAHQEAVPVNLKESSSWQRAQWENCEREFHKHLDPGVREKEMRTLDAAYVAISRADGGWEESRTLSFETDGVPSEAVYVKDGEKASLDIFRKGALVGQFRKDGDVYSGESTGIRLDANPLVYSSTRVEANITLAVDGVVLGTFEANGPMENVEVSQDIITGISFRGSVDADDLWKTLRELTDAETEKEAVPLVEKAASAIDIKVYYEGDLSEARGYVTMVPLHYKNRYDDYWTWELILMAADGTKVDRNTFFVDQFMASDNDEKSAFYNAWNNLLPHILRAVVL